MRFLQQLGEHYKTDKADIHHTFSGKSYLDMYEECFWFNRDNIKCILEIGVLGGNSLKMWRDYFPNSKVWGLDIDPKSDRDYGDRINVIIGDQIDENTISKIAPNEQFDLVIDDGSHIVDHIITSFDILWSRIKSGGFYVIEDLGCSYGDITNSINAWPGQHLNLANTNFVNDMSKLHRFFLQKIYNIDNRISDVRSVKFTCYQCFIEKI
jgi:hypothetical protein